MNFGDKITIKVETVFGIVNVEFTVIAVLPNYHYALIAQNRVVVGQQKAGGSWILSDSVDLMKILPISDVYHYPKA